MNILLSHPFVFLAIIWLVLTVPAMTGKTSLKRYGLAVLVSAFGVVVPLFVFFLSAGLVPDWKGACKHGWLDCFHEGKLALTPLVLWATGALYTVEVCRVEPPFNRSVVLGLFTGMVVAGACFVYGLISVASYANAVGLWLLVPLYIAVWHGTRWTQAMRGSNIDAPSLVWTFCGSIPFWIGSVLWSRRIFESLPNTPPNCFVVTAAGRGHRAFVGPFVRINRHGRAQFANRQLLTLWQLEALWRAGAPRSHAAFRRGYNFIGPAIARRITSRWTADAVYVALKPAELLARLILNLAVKPNCSDQPRTGVSL